jgi:C4-type Zn-finger protein
MLRSTRIMPTKECPLCSGAMRLRHVETVVRVPGNPNATTRTVYEWVCPDCDYFEEAEEDR